jgi:hypothetical protein
MKSMRWLKKHCGIGNFFLGGWVGVVVGSRYYLDFSVPTMFPIISPRCSQVINVFLKMFPIPQHFIP